MVILDTYAKYAGNVEIIERIVWKIVKFSQYKLLSILEKNCLKFSF